VDEWRSPGRLLTAGSLVLLALVATVALVNQPNLSADGGPRPGPTAVTSPFRPPLNSLRMLAAARGLRVGTAVNVDALLSDPRYEQVLAQQFSSLTPEVAMKWEATEPEQGRYDWSRADRIIATAERYGQQVYGHTLVWHDGLPDWLITAGFGREDLAGLLQRHVQDEVSRYRGKVWAWDVVNEPLDMDGTLRDSIWSRALGPGYIADALRWTRAADPKVKLYLNDYQIEGLSPKSDGMYRLVRGLLAHGVPLDGVGFQVHWTTDALPANMVKNLRRFTALGLDVSITEADVRVPMPPSRKKLDAQASVYRQAMDACLAVKRCVSFSVWGFTDKYSWIPSVKPGTGAACLFDASFKPKAAYTAITRSLSRSSR
jgi:endo-1,4-beta-xylanase